MVNEEKQAVVSQIRSLAVNIETDGTKLKQYAENAKTDEQAANLKEVITAVKKDILTVFSKIEELTKNL